MFKKRTHEPGATRAARTGRSIFSLARTSLLLSSMAMLPAISSAAEVNSTGLAVTDSTVTVGILHSVTGTMAISETGAQEAEKLAIKQINESGGILGRQIEIIQEDGASDWPTFAEKSKKLLVQDKVAAVFGAWTSASRKAVLPVFEKEIGLLYYPTFYEGLEQSKNVIYTGQEATQQILDGLNWVAKEKKAKTFYLIGSDYIWPRTSMKIARKHIEKVLGGKVVGEEYKPLGNTQFGSVINKIRLKKPDVIYAAVVGGSNVAWFKQLKAAGITSKKQTLLTISVTEDEADRVVEDEDVQEVPEEKLDADDDQLDDDQSDIEGDELSLTELKSTLKQVVGYIKKEDANHNRSRDSLYNILTAIYEFHQTCERSPDAYDEIVDEAGLKVQSRAPFTPVLKICLGKDYDKTRLTEYSAALGIARYMDVEVDEFHDFIKNFPGGIKGCVKEMRIIRKHGASGNVMARKTKSVEEARAILREMAPIASFRLKKVIVGNKVDEFCLLLAKRDGHDINVLKIIDDKYTKLDPIIKRTAFIKGNLNDRK